VLGAFSSSMLTFIVFVLSAMLIVVQIASAQLTPRIIVAAFSKRLVRIALTLFTFSYIYTVSTLGGIEESVPQLPVAVAVGSNLACLVVFVRFVQQFGTGLRPLAVLQDVAQQGRTAIDDVYPQLFDAARERTGWPKHQPPAAARVIAHLEGSGVLQAFSVADIVAAAEGAGAIVEMVPQVGDFVTRGDPLFRVTSERQLVDDVLRQCVALGVDRTIEQDPRFAFRIAVDIACKALSPAINDPTTAVLALDQLHRLLLVVGGRRLDFGEVHDASGELRLVYGTPDWPDYVCLAATEIRQYGAGSLQIARRLGAMLEHLISVLPEARRPPLEQELRLLRRSVDRAFADAEDRALAGIGDYQGVGGSTPSQQGDRVRAQVEPVSGQGL